MGKVYGEDGREIPWSDVFADLGMTDLAAEQFADEMQAVMHDPSCASLPHAVKQDDPDLDRDAPDGAKDGWFDCLLCRFTFRPAGAAWTLPGGEQHRYGRYSLCDCCRRQAAADPAMSAEMVAVWTQETGLPVPDDVLVTAASPVR